MAGFVQNCNRAVRWGLLALIVFTPLAFGTVEDWSMAVMEWGVVTLFLVFMVGRLWQPDRTARRWFWLTGLEWPLGLFLLFCLAQTIPLPAAWLTAISPGTARLYSIPHDSETDLSVTMDPGLESGTPIPGRSSPAMSVDRPLSVRPNRTFDSVRLTIVFMLMFLMVAWWADRGKRIVYLVTAITTVGFFVALQALIQFMTWNGKLLWWRPASGGRAFGPFANHNHFAGYVEMIIPLAIGLALYLLDRRRHPPAPRPVEEGEGEDEPISPTVEEPGGYREKGFLALFAAVILGVSLVFCLSRGGLLSALISGLVLVALLWKRMVSKRLAWTIVLLLPLLAVALILWIGPAEVFEQIGTYDGMRHEASFRSRALVWFSIVRNAGEYIWTGTGLGTFEDSFAQFTPPGAATRWHRAHNDYLQLFWETGIIGFSLFLMGALVFARRYWLPAIRSREHPLDVIRIGTAVSLMSIALHSLVDFNLQVGSNGLLFAILAGLLAALTRAIENADSGEPLELLQEGKEA